VTGEGEKKEATASFSPEKAPSPIPVRPVAVSGPVTLSQGIEAQMPKIIGSRESAKAEHIEWLSETVSAILKMTPSSVSIRAIDAYAQNFASYASILEKEYLNRISTDIRLHLLERESLEKDFEGEKDRLFKKALNVTVLPE
jgi:hypothetical protein